MNFLIASSKRQIGDSRSWPLPLLAIALTVCGFATQLVNVCLTAGNLKNFAIGGFFQLVGIAILLAVWRKVDVRKLGEKRHVVWGVIGLALGASFAGSQNAEIALVLLTTLVLAGGAYLSRAGEEGEEHSRTERLKDLSVYGALGLFGLLFLVNTFFPSLLHGLETEESWQAKQINGWLIGSQLFGASNLIVDATGNLERSAIPWSDFPIVNTAVVLGGVFAAVEVGLCMALVVMLIRSVFREARSNRLAMGLGILLAFRITYSVLMQLGLVPLHNLTALFIWQPGLGLWLYCAALGLIAAIQREGGFHAERE